VTNLGLIYWPLANGDVMTSANKAYQGAGVSVRTPFKRHRYRPKLSRWRAPQDLENPGQAALQPLLDGRNGGAVLVVHMSPPTWIRLLRGCLRSKTINLLSASEYRHAA
jgi:hypothetical protein